MGLTEREVLDLVEQKALRAHRFGGWGVLLVECAIVNVKPQPRPAKRAPAKEAAAVHKTTTTTTPVEVDVP
jgi:hypothetical protein